MLKKTVLLMIILSVSFNVIPAQEKKVLTYSSGEVQMLLEVNGIVKVDKDKFVLDLFMPADKRKDEYKKVDLQSGDEIVFFNGKKIKSLGDFTNYYEELKTGEEIKLGVKRNGNSVITAFKKMKQEEGAGGMKIIKMENGKITEGDGKNLNIDSLKKSGVIIKREKK
ncbi:MAG: PDZ domain-containing protein [bacterium]